MVHDKIATKYVCMSKCKNSGMTINRYDYYGDAAMFVIFLLHFLFFLRLDCNSVSQTDQLNTQQLIGMSPSEPHASRTALCTHVSVCLN